MKYLLKHLDKLKHNLKKNNLYIFLDYDGTLAPIVRNPKDAVISKETINIIKTMVNIKDCKISVISGRSLKDVKNKVNIKGIIYTGNHGLEINGNSIYLKIHMSNKQKSILKHIKYKLQKELSLLKGIIIEDKEFTLSIHYRMLNKAKYKILKTKFMNVIEPYRIKKYSRITYNKKIFEVKPSINWNKGNAVLWILRNDNFKNKNIPIIPIYIGDDKTDEDAFEVLNKNGITIFVGEKKKSKANYYLKTTKEVKMFLKNIIDIKIRNK